MTEKSGATEADLELLWEALSEMWHVGVWIDQCRELSLVSGQQEGRLPPAHAGNRPYAT